MHVVWKIYKIGGTSVQKVISKTSMRYQIMYYPLFFLLES